MSARPRLAINAFGYAFFLLLLGVIAIAAVVAIGLDIADPLIGLTITLLILRITWQSWRTVRDDVRRATHHHQ